MSLICQNMISTKIGNLPVDVCIECEFFVSAMKSDKIPHQV